MSFSILRTTESFFHMFRIMQRSDDGLYIGGN